MKRRKTFLWRGRLRCGSERPFPMRPFRGSMRWAALWAGFVGGGFLFVPKGRVDA